MNRYHRTGVDRHQGMLLPPSVEEYVSPALDQADAAHGDNVLINALPADHNRTLLTDHIAVLRAVLRSVKRRHPFHIDAMVILPDHLRAMWTLPEGDADYPLRWSLIKMGFSRHMAKMERRNPSRVNKGERGIWQRRYWERMTRDEHDYGKHVD